MTNLGRLRRVIAAGLDAPVGVNATEHDRLLVEQAKNALEDTWPALLAVYDAARLQHTHTCGESRGFDEPEPECVACRYAGAIGPRARDAIGALDTAIAAHFGGAS